MRPVVVSAYRPGTRPASASASSPPAWKARRSSPLTTATDTGTRWIFSDRRSAVTTISPRPFWSVVSVAVAVVAVAVVCAVTGAATSAANAEAPASRVERVEIRMCSSLKRWPGLVVSGKARTSTALPRLWRGSPFRSSGVFPARYPAR